MTIRSNPPGALVFIDGQEIGRTPVATPFTYYGTRNFRLVKDGYETVSVNQQFRAPWYQVPPLDFVSENMVANELRDERVVDFDLVPRANISPGDVLIHADQLRGEIRPAAAMMPIESGDYSPEEIPIPSLESNPAESIPAPRGGNSPAEPIQDSL